MKGGLFIIRQDGLVERRELTRPPTGKELHDIIDGYLEIVPFWNHLKTLDINSSCVAFCDSDGKTVGNKKLNESATTMWENVLRLQGKTSIGVDYLVGDIVVVWGDRQLLEAL
jgi:hypothetical protein